MVIGKLYNLLEFYLYVIVFKNLRTSLLLNFCKILCSPFNLIYNYLKRFATLYAQLRPVTLPRQRLTAAAGTLLARDSLWILNHSFKSTHRLYSFNSLHDYSNLSSPQIPGSNFHSLTNILHCCQRWVIFHFPCD